ncbi:thiopurine S-methyltransferase-like [Crassostrea virginica]
MTEDKQPQFTVASPEYWQKRWEERKIGWHKTNVDSYVEILSSLLAPNFCYLVETFEFDETKHSGPPFFVSDKDLNDLYGEKFTLTKLDRQDAFEEQHKAWGIDSFFEKLHLITPKK